MHLDQILEDVLQQLVVAPLRPHLVALFDQGFEENTDGVKITKEPKALLSKKPFSKIPETIKENLGDGNVMDECSKLITEFFDEFHDSAYHKLHLVFKISRLIIDKVNMIPNEKYVLILVNQYHCVHIVMCTQSVEVKSAKNSNAN